MDKPSAAPAQKNSALTLEEAIIKGLSESAGEATVRLLEQNMDALAIINEKLIPALDVVGKDLKKRKCSFRSY